jgi:hypothetical protein
MDSGFIIVGASGFAGGCYAGIQMLHSRRRGVLIIGLTMFVIPLGMYVIPWLAHVFFGFRKGETILPDVFTWFGYYLFFGPGLVALLCSAGGCSASWLIGYCCQLFRRRR